MYVRTVVYVSMGVHYLCMDEQRYICQYVVYTYVSRYICMSTWGVHYTCEDSCICQHGCTLCMPGQLYMSAWVYTIYARTIVYVSMVVRYVCWARFLYGSMGVHYVCMDGLYIC